MENITVEYTEVAETTKKTSNGLISMICGIISVAIPLPVFGLIFGLLGIIFYLKGKKEPDKGSAFSTVGLICSIAGILLGAIVSAVMLIVIVLPLLAVICFVIIEVFVTLIYVAYIFLIMMSQFFSIVAYC